jgi:hypothetical protein
LDGNDGGDGDGDSDGDASMRQHRQTSRDLIGQIAKKMTVTSDQVNNILPASLMDAFMRVCVMKWRGDSIDHKLWLGLTRWRYHPKFGLRGEEVMGEVK